MSKYMIRAMLMVVVIGAMVTSRSFAESAAWTEDWDAAVKQASKENKDILVGFTGSDWCHWCIKLNEEVFDHDTFVKAATKDFVLVKLDFPRGKPQPAKIRQRNQRLAGEFGVQGYPTIFLVDSQGRPYARTGYQPGGPTAYLPHLSELQKVRQERDALLKQAESAKASEKAAILDKALSLVVSSIGTLSGYDSIIATIVELDTENTAGLKTKYGTMLALKGAVGKLQTGDLKGAIKIIDAFLEEHKPEGDPKQRFLFLKGIAHYHSKELPQAVAALEEALKADPEGQLADDVKNAIEQFKSELPKN